MGKMKQLLVTAFFLFLLFFAITAHSQTNVNFRNNEFENLEEYLESISMEEGDIDNFLDKIDFFANNKIDLAKSTANQIAEIPGITYFDAYFIVDRIQKYPNVTINELSELYNFNEFQRFILNKCAFIGKPDEKVQLFSAKIRERTSYQIETPIGYENGKYLGGKWNLYQNYQANYTTTFADSNIWKFNTGGIINKNSGEQNLAEYYSGYFVVDNKNVKLVAGDFSIKAGMGNVFGESFSYGKGINVIAPTINYNNKISPYLSKMDYLRMRGIAGRFDFPLFWKNRISSSVWYSNSPRSATINKEDFVSSLYTASVYRTETDIAKKNAIYEKNIGGTLELNGCDYSIGGLLTYFDFSKEIRSNSSRAFVGKDGFMSSLFGILYFDKVNLSSEVSFDNNSKVGCKVGTAYKSKNLDVAFHFRSFDENFRSPYGSIFGEFSYPSNEYGLYFGTIWKPNQKAKLSSYLDLYRSYASTYTVDTNVYGFEIFTQYDYKFNSRNSIYGRVNYKTKTAQTRIDRQNVFFQREKLGIRLEGERRFTNFLKVRSRVDFVSIDNADVLENEFGAAAFIEVNIKVFDWLKIQSRVTYFSTDSYTSAIWQFEYYYPGYSYAPALYLDGTRSFLALQISPLKRLDIYLRYVNLYKFDVESLGSSYEKIDGNRQNRIYCQIDLKI